MSNHRKIKLRALIGAASLAGSCLLSIQAVAQTATTNSCTTANTVSAGSSLSCTTTPAISVQAGGRYQINATVDAYNSQTQNYNTNGSNYKVFVPWTMTINVNGTAVQTVQSDQPDQAGQAVRSSELYYVNTSSQPVSLSVNLQITNNLSSAIYGREIFHHNSAINSAIGDVSIEVSPPPPPPPRPPHQPLRFDRW